MPSVRPRLDAPPGLGSLLVSAVLGVMCGSIVWTAARSGDLAVAKYWAVGVVLYAWVIGYGIRARLRPTSSIGVESTAQGPARTVLRYSRRQFALMVALASAVAAVAAMGAADVVRNWSAVPLAPLALVLLIALALCTASFPLEVALGRIRWGWIGLSPAGIHRRGWASESAVAWTDVREVRDIGGRNLRFGISLAVPATSRRTSRLWRLEPLLPHLIDVEASYFAAERGLVRRFVEFYVDHPERRAELGTRTSVDRLRDGDFHPA